jgi:mannose-6-phosphate isomerase-like protein (cupin superfamily)
MGNSNSNLMLRHRASAFVLCLLPVCTLAATPTDNLQATAAATQPAAEQRVSERLRHKDRAANATQGAREVLLDNSEVQVVRLTYPPGSESGMHGHEYPNRVIYVVRGGVLEMIPGNGAKPMQTVEVTDGQVAYVPAMTHNVRNVGDSEVVLIETEIK